VHLLLAGIMAGGSMRSSECPFSSVHTTRVHGPCGRAVSTGMVWTRAVDTGSVYRAIHG